MAYSDGPMSTGFVGIAEDDAILLSSDRRVPNARPDLDGVRRS